MHIGMQYYFYTDFWYLYSYYMYSMITWPTLGQTVRFPDNYSGRACIARASKLILPTFTMTLSYNICKFGTIFNESIAQTNIYTASIVTLNATLRLYILPNILVLQGGAGIRLTPLCQRWWLAAGNSATPLGRGGGL